MKDDLFTEHQRTLEAKPKVECWVNVYDDDIFAHESKELAEEHLSLHLKGRTVHMLEAEPLERRIRELEQLNTRLGCALDAAHKGLAALDARLAKWSTARRVRIEKTAFSACLGHKFGEETYVFDGPADGPEYITVVVPEDE